MSEKLGEWDVIGEFSTYPAPDPDAGKPWIVQSWVPLEMVSDPDPNSHMDSERWCVTLAEGKIVELRAGDRIVVLRRSSQ